MLLKELSLLDWYYPASQPPAWDALLKEWFDIRDVDKEGEIELDEYIELNKRTWKLMNYGDVDESEFKEKFTLLDTNKVECLFVYALG